MAIALPVTEQERRITKRMDDKVIVLAGSGAIGSACAHRYAIEGASVLIGDMDAAAATSVAEEIRELGGSAVGVELDGTREDSIAAMVARAVSEFGGIDGLHANFASFADGSATTDLLEMPLEVYDEEMRVDARGFLLCSRHVIPELRKRGGGSIVYMSSAAAYIPAPVRLAYSMAKSAILSLTRHVAGRFGPENIRANAIAPGLILTPRLDTNLTAEQKEFFRQQSLFRDRLGRPEDVAAMASFLLSDDGAFVTGQVLCVDGGATCRP